MNVRVVNRMMPWIACGSAAILAVVIFFEQAGPTDPEPTRPGPTSTPGGVGQGLVSALVPPAELAQVEPARVEPSTVTPPGAGSARGGARDVPPARRAKLRTARHAPPTPVTPPELEEAPDLEPPELVVITPSGPEFSLRPDLEARVRSEPGARVLVSGRTLLEGPAGLFSGTLRLSAGANELRVTAEDQAGNRVARLVRVTYVDLDRVGRDRQRIERMVRQLEDIRAAAVELDRRILVLLEKMEAMRNADELARLSEELHRIRKTRRAVSGELANALGQVDSLLAVAP